MGDFSDPASMKESPGESDRQYSSELDKRIRNLVIWGRDRYGSWKARRMAQSRTVISELLESGSTRVVNRRLETDSVERDATVMIHRKPEYARLEVKRIKQSAERCVGTTVRMMEMRAWKNDKAELLTVLLCKS